MKRFCFCLIIIISQFTFGQSAFPLTIKGQLKVKFPNFPIIENREYFTYYIVKTDDYFLNVCAVNFNDNQFLLGKELDLDELYDGYINGVLDAANNGKELSRKPIVIKKWEALEVKISSDIGDLNNLISTHTILLVDRVCLYIRFTKLSNLNVDHIIESVINSVEKL